MVVYFYKASSPFSNFYWSPFLGPDGKRFMTLEHWFMHYKALLMGVESWASRTRNEQDAK